MDYTKFKSITLHDTGLFYGEMEVVYKRLKKDNGINTLQELFEKYDNNTIEYGTSTKTSFYKEEVKGVIELLRFKYLEIPINFNPNKNLFTSFFEGENIRKTVQSRGIPTKFAVLIENIVLKNPNITLYDAFKYCKINIDIIDSKYGTFNDKLNILLDYCKQVELGIIKLPIEEDNKLSARNLREQELTEVFNNADWLTYNDTQLLESDNDVAIYASYKRKIRRNIN